MDELAQLRAKILRNSVRFAFNTVERRYQNLCNLISKFPATDGENDEIISLAWDIIDWADRLRKLLNHGAGIKKSEEWYQEFIQVIDRIEPMRHFVQHIDRSLEESLKTRTLLFGDLSAAFLDAQGRQCLMVALPSGHKIMPLSNPVICIDGRERFDPPVDQVRLRMGKFLLNISNLMRLITIGKREFEAFAQRLESTSKP